MSKILFIGQALPAKPQDYPYSSTMLYSWLAVCGYSVARALNTFEFDAVYNHFPGYAEGGGHKAPTREQMESHWPELYQKIIVAPKIITLGKIAAVYIREKGIDKPTLELMHPSLMNKNRYEKDPEAIIGPLKEFINQS